MAKAIEELEKLCKESNVDIATLKNNDTNSAEKM